MTKKFKKAISMILTLAMLGAMSTGVFAENIEFAERSAGIETMPRSFDRTFSKSINSVSFVQVAWDTNVYAGDDTLRFSVTDDGSAEPQQIEFKLIYDENEDYTIICMKAMNRR